MARCWTVALLIALVPTATTLQAGDKKEKDIRIEEKLTKDDPKDKKRGFASKLHLIKMQAAHAYTIDMVSTEFDAYLRLEDKDGQELAEDDDGGGNLNARIIFNCAKDGEYRVICTCYRESVGNYTLTVRKSLTNQPLGTPHSLLIGKAAPNFKGDFALNGKAAQLSDFQGKVVLLDFWAVQASACTTTFPQLRDWNKVYKSAGLEIVGVTFYSFEIGQKLGFDKETGKLHKRDQANQASDQAMFNAFAVHHKLEHLLLTLHKDNAVKTFDAYGVNGVPQVVLIDRKGVIRFIRAGEVDVNAAALETEIKKLLAEKPVPEVPAQVGQTDVANKNNLKQIGIAFHGYESINRRFPPAAIFAKDGKALLSWRVALLPYLEQEGLYKEFKLDESWDSPHNIKLVDKMPKVFGPISDGPDDIGKTLYRVFTGPGTVFDGTMGAKITDITDGTSNTLLVVESREAVPWTKPAELPYSDKEPLPKLGADKKAFVVLLCDGTVMKFRAEFNEQQMRYAILRADGKVVDFTQLER